MADVDFGYGDQDHGYGDANPDYGYGDQDYDYGNASPAPVDYGYGDAPPDDDTYGYGNARPDDQEPQNARRPKRRCSVTKFNLEQNESGNPSGIMAASVISDMRRGMLPPAESLPASEIPKTDNESIKCTSPSEEDEKHAPGRKKSGGFMRLLGRNRSSCSQG
jgi:hypothetical protein